MRDGGYVSRQVDVQAELKSGQEERSFQGSATCRRRWPNVLASCMKSSTSKPQTEESTHEQLLGNLS